MSRVKEMDIWMAMQYPGLSVGEAISNQKVNTGFPWQQEVKEKLGINKSDEIDGIPNFTNTAQTSELYQDQLRMRKQINEIHQRELEDMKLNQEIQKLHMQHIKRTSTERIECKKWKECEAKTLIF